MNFDAIVFPGQGAQRLNMGMDFVEEYPAAKAVFATAKTALDFDPLEVVQHDETKLNLTPYTQPCIVATEIAMYQVLLEQLESTPKFFGGHSLGEYSALVAAGVMPFDIALKLVRTRGQLMQDAISGGAMAAIIIKDLPYEQVKAIADKHQVDLANHNSIKQVVISGLADGVEATITDLKTNFGEQVRCVSLNVSAPFHSRHMKSISEPFYDYLQQYRDSYNGQYLPQVLSNYSGEFYDNDIDQLIDSLTCQLYSVVKWQENMQQLVKSSTNILELGPNRPLRGFFQAMDVSISAICNVNALNKLKETCQ